MEIFRIWVGRLFFYFDEILQDVHQNSSTYPKYECPDHIKSANIILLIKPHYNDNVTGSAYRFNSTLFSYHFIGI